MPGAHAVPNADLADLDKRFTYHPPKDGQADRYTCLRSKAHRMARLILEECPPSRERSLSLTKLEEAVMWANAAIARHE